MAKPLVVVARLKAKPGKESELEAELKALIPQTHREPGCLLYRLHRAVEDPARFVFYEHWASEEAFNAHMQTPYLQALLPRIPDLTAEPPDITTYEQLPGGLPEKS